MRHYKTTIPSRLAALALVVFLAVATGCLGGQAVDNMKPYEPLAACPDSPNCVSSESQDPRHAVYPMQLAGNTQTEWAELQAVLSRLPRVTIVTATGHYLHAAVKSRIFGFVDDLELKPDPKTNKISIRSASRSGYYDFGVNRRRVEDLRRRLTAASLIR